MSNKVLVTIKIPDIEKEYNVFLPINKKLGNILYLLNKAIRELNNNKEIFKQNTNNIYNLDTGKTYDLDKLLYETDIRNGSRLILI